MPPHSLRPETVLVKSGRPPAEPDGPLNTPIMPASALHPGGHSGYARDGSPGWSALEQALGTLEGGFATCFSSGMAAVTAALSPLAPGARVVAPRMVYRGARHQLQALQESGSATVDWVDLHDTDAVIAACDSADVLWLESPGNPLIEVADLPALCGLARERDIYCVVDGTMATPLLQSPLDLGADVVMHSATKWIGGHSDLLLGALVTRDRGLADAFVEERLNSGATPGALEAFLALRGLRTLAVRMERAQANALELARRLDGHPDVTLVRYPGLESSPDHERASSFMRGFGAVLAFEVTGGPARAQQLTEETRVFTYATSFGGVDSSLERRARWRGEEGVPQTLIRVSVGLEHIDDLWEDISHALSVSADAMSATGRDAVAAPVPIAGP